MQRKMDILRPDVKDVRRLCREVPCSRVVASILVNRGINDPRDADFFLNADLKELPPPFSLKGMEAAVRRIHSAIDLEQKILIFGDYDVDGVTATALLLEFLRALNADVSYYIPHRTREGYGLKTEHISGHAVRGQFDLIITVDCGSSSHKAVKAARDAGIDVIITDHHQILPDLPGACAVVNPQRHDCHAGFKALAGVGVAFCLLICLRAYLRKHGFFRSRREPNLKAACDMVALGTVSDMVPLVKENRILCRSGLDVLNSRRRPGIAALIDVSGIKDRPVGADDIAFKLGPRLNAAGRLARAESALKLLLAADLNDARLRVAALDELNRTRQGMEKAILLQIEELLDNDPHLAEKKAIVLDHHDWHLGVLGIVASRLVKRYYRPVVLISTADDVGRGSARSIPGFDLYRGLTACADHFLRFGGHTMAAGLEIPTENIGAFRRQFDAVVEKTTEPEDFIRRLEVDCELNFDQVTPGLIDELERLKPFGSGNPQPLFTAAGVVVRFSRVVGGYHRKMTLEQPVPAPGRRIEAIEFNVDMNRPLPDRFERLVFRLGWNLWRGRRAAQIIIERV